MNINYIIKCIGLYLWYHWSSGSQLYVSKTLCFLTQYLKATLLVLLLNDETDCLYGCIDIFMLLFQKFK